MNVLLIKASENAAYPIPAWRIHNALPQRQTFTAPTGRPGLGIQTVLRDLGMLAGSHGQVAMQVVGPYEAVNTQRVRFRWHFQNDNICNAASNERDCVGRSAVLPHHKSRLTVQKNFPPGYRYGRSANGQLARKCHFSCRLASERTPDARSIGSCCDGGSTTRQQQQGIRRDHGWLLDESVESGMRRHSRPSTSSRARPKAGKSAG